jgi:transposase-like protein
LGTEKLWVDELDAIYFMVSTVFERPMKYLPCTLCGFPHLDRDWFSVHKHKRHLCHGCGRNFSDVEEGIGNPAVKLQQVLGSAGPRALVPAPQSLDIKQQDFPGGIQIWGSNPAIVWTAHKSEEEGIHVHGYRDAHSEPAFDGTFHSVSIDGMSLDADMVRCFMAQSAMPHIRERVIYLKCPSCGGEHFDRGELGYVPHDEHHCEHCGRFFKAPTRIKKTIGNPFIRTREQLAGFAIRTPQRPYLNLRLEAI